MRRWLDRAGARGAVATEFVVILPLLVLLTFGTFAMARAWNVHNVLDHAAREAARHGATVDPWDPDGEDEVRGVAEGVLGASFVGATSIDVDPVRVAGGGCVDDADVYAGLSNDDVPARIQVCVTIEDYPLHLGFLTWHVSMRAASVSRYEGTADPAW